MKWILTVCLLSSVVFAQEWVDPEKCLQKLLDGNDRFVQEMSHHPRQDLPRRRAVSEGQSPCAVVLSCSDSRVPPEIVFDQGIGDVFVVRVAGNVVGPIEMESIEFACDVLHASLIFVLGHENCGAVNAVLTGNTADIQSIAALIKPAVDESRKQQGNQLSNAIKNNVHGSIKALKKSPVLQKMLVDGKVAVVGGYYELASGKVLLID